MSEPKVHLAESVLVEPNLPPEFEPLLEYVRASKPNLYRWWQEAMASPACNTQGGVRTTTNRDEVTCTRCTPSHDTRNGVMAIGVGLGFLSMLRYGDEAPS